MEVQSFVGVGQVYLENLKQSKGLVPIGEVSKLELAVEVNKLTLQSNTQSGGGLADSVTRITGVNVSMDISTFSTENIARAMYGSSETVALGVVVDEGHDANPGALVSFVNPPDLTKAVTVKSKVGSTAYVKGTDYELTAAGILIKDGGAISTKTAILVGYSGLGHDLIQVLTNSGDPYRLYFEGLNEANSDSPVLVDLYRTKFDPTASFGLITDAFGTMAVSGTVLKDTSKTGDGISKYFNIKKV